VDRAEYMAGGATWKNWTRIATARWTARVPRPRGEIQRIEANKAGAWVSP
jgi:hypothetical protein